MAMVGKSGISSGRSNKKVVGVRVCGEVVQLEKDVAQRWGLIADMYENNTHTGEIEASVT